MILAVENVERSVAFYRRAFGWTPAVTTPVYVELEIAGGTRLGLYDRVGFGRNTGQAPPAAVPQELSRTELYLRVDALPAAIASLEDAGARCLSAAAARTWGDTAAYFADPDGNVVVVAVRSP